VRAIRAGNKLQDKPYRYGGGHRSFADSAYDCSGTVSFALHGAGLLDAPLASGGLMTWGRAHRGRWITVYANAGHAYMVIAGLRLDTSGSGGRGPRWQTAGRSSASFVARHPRGF
jgi:peptidoglycan hydrolase